MESPVYRIRTRSRRGFSADEASAELKSRRKRTPPTVTTESSVLTRRRRRLATPDDDGPSQSNTVHAESPLRKRRGRLSTDAAARTPSSSPVADERESPVMKRRRCTDDSSPSVVESPVEETCIPKKETPVTDNTDSITVDDGADDNLSRPGASGSATIKEEDGGLKTGQDSALVKGVDGVVTATRLVKIDHSDAVMESFDDTIARPDDLCETPEKSVDEVVTATQFVEIDHPDAVMELSDDTIARSKDLSETPEKPSQDIAQTNVDCAPAAVEIAAPSAQTDESGPELKREDNPTLQSAVDHEEQPAIGPGESLVERPGNSPKDSIPSGSQLQPKSEIADQIEPDAVDSSVVGTGGDTELDKSKTEDFPPAAAAPLVANLKVDAVTNRTITPVSDSHGVESVNPPPVVSMDDSDIIKVDSDIVKVNSDITEVDPKVEATETGQSVSDSTTVSADAPVLDAPTVDVKLEADVKPVFPSDQKTATATADSAGGAVVKTEDTTGGDESAAAPSPVSDGQSWTPGSQPGGRRHHLSADSDSRSTVLTTGEKDGGEKGITPSRGRSLSGSRSGSRSGSLCGSRSQSRAEQGPVRVPHRPGMDFRVGSRLEARDYLNMWYASRVIQVDWDEKEVLIHFERWNSRFDEWVAMDSPRLRAISRVSARKERRESSHTVPKEYKLGEIVEAKWVDCKMYPAKILSQNADDSYNVMFYDGYEKNVQSINVRKMPPEQAATVDFSLEPNADSPEEKAPPTRPPTKKTEPRSRRTSGVVKTERGDDSPAPGTSHHQSETKKPEAEKVETRKRAHESKSAQSAVTPKGFRSSSVASSEGSGRQAGGSLSAGAAGANKRKKLVVGGIFQAKRHHLAVKTGGNLAHASAEASPNRSAASSPHMETIGTRRVIANANAQKQLATPSRTKSATSTPAPSRTKSATNMPATPRNKSSGPPPPATEPAIGPAVKEVPTGVDSVILVGSETFVPTADGVLSPYHAPKEFLIEEDHNHFKCPVAGCNKSFRKEQLLASHTKHYHDIKKKKATATTPTASSVIPSFVTIPTIPDVPKLPASATPTAVAPPTMPMTSTPAPLPDANAERKLISEKRRQMLFQKRIETMCKQHQQQQLLDTASSPTRTRTPTRRLVSETSSPAPYHLLQQQLPSLSVRMECIDRPGTAALSGLAAVAASAPYATVVQPPPLSTSSSSVGGAGERMMPLAPQNRRRRGFLSQKADRFRKRRCAADAAAAAEEKRLSMADPLGASISAVVNQPYLPVEQLKNAKAIASAEAAPPGLPAESVPPVTSCSTRRRRQRNRPERSYVTSEELHATTNVLPKDTVKATDSRKRPNRLSRDSCSASDAQPVGGGPGGVDSVEYDELDREEVVNCCCQQQEEDGLMMQCEVCLAWQHGICFNIEDEDQVPERYVCFACENPKGLRESFRYRHNQDWFKLGEMASFRFLPPRNAWPLQSDMLRTHNVAAQLLSVNKMLHGLRVKMAVVKQPNHPNLALFARPSQESPHAPDPVIPDDVSPSPWKTESGAGGSAVDDGAAAFNFIDHSYSYAGQDHVYGAEVVVSDMGHEGGGGGDGDFPLEVAAHEVTIDTTVETQLSQPLVANGDVVAAGVAEDTTMDLTTTGASASSVGAWTPHGGGAAGGSHRPCNLSAGERQKLRDRCTKKRIVKKEVNVTECQLNLLDHMEQTQLVLDRRLDELELLLEGLEANSEVLPTLVLGGNPGKSAADQVMTKRMLRAMVKDLSKVQQLSRFQ